MAAALIKALRENTEAGLTLLDVNRRNFGEDVMNRAASRGTLYSTGGAAQQSRYDATEYMPRRSSIQLQQQGQEFNINNQLIETKNKIDAMKRATQELNKIDDKYFESLLV